jgi:rhamnosyltransferase
MNKSMKLLGIIITYYPDIQETKNNILQFVDDIDLLIIWENTPRNERERYKISLPEYQEKIIFMGTDENMFIAHALNQGIKFGKENGFSHLLTMDQDICFDTGHFKKYKQIVDSDQNSLSIYGPNPNNNESLDRGILVEKPYLITSGNIVSLRIFDEVGLYREDYKIDCVDYEFCLRLQKKGYYCRMVPTVVMKQEFGVLRKMKYGYFTSNYSPVRLYFIARNQTLLKKEFPDAVNQLPLLKLKRMILKILLSEDDKYNKIKFLVKGLIDGISNRE